MAGMEDAVSYMMGANSNTNRHDGFNLIGFGAAMILFFLIFGGWGNGLGGNNAMNNNGYDALLAGQNSIKSQMSYDNLSTNINGVSRGICDSTYALDNTMTNGFSGIKSELCQLNGSIMQNGWNISDKISQMSAANNLQLQALSNQLGNCCCQMKELVQQTTQTILNKLCDQTTNALQAKIFEMSQDKQTTQIIAALTPKTTAAAA